MKSYSPKHHEHQQVTEHNSASHPIVIHIYDARKVKMLQFFWGLGLGAWGVERGAWSMELGAWSKALRPDMVCFFHFITTEQSALMDRAKARCLA